MVDATPGQRVTLLTISSLALVKLDSTLVDAANAHLARHVMESGRDGHHWLPYDPRTRTKLPSMDAVSLLKGFDEVGWERWYVVVDQAEQVVGHASLTGARFDRGLHRCVLGMGLEQPYWRQGWGDRLLRKVINLALDVQSLDWLDLRVLGSNAPAISLYKKHGFREVARVPDYCRIDGHPEDDVLMTLELAPQRKTP